MQAGKGDQLRREWGDKPCDHPYLEKEYHLGMHTGDYICTTCGEAGWGRDWPKKEREQNKIYE